MRNLLRVWAFVGTQFIVSLPAIADGPDTLWTKIYGGIDDDYGHSVQECASGGFIIAGKTSSFGAGSGDVYLVRTDADGDTLWTRTYGGTEDDGGNSVQECVSGGFIIAGTTKSFGAGYYDVYLIRTDVDGDTLWTKTYGGTPDDFGNSVAECAGGGFIITGMTWSFGAGERDVYLIRTNADGDTLWTKTYGGTGGDYGYSVQECADSGFIITGWTYSFGASYYDVYLIRTDADGDTLWTKTYGGTGYDAGGSVQECAGGGFIIAGVTESFGAGLRDVYLIRTNADGDTLWTKTYGGTDFDWGCSVEECAGGGFIIAGWTGSFGTGYVDVYLIRTDADGDTLWTKTYGGTGYNWGKSVQECADGGFIIAGWTESFGVDSADVYLIRVSETGVEEETGNRHKAIGISLEVYPNPCFGKAVIRYTCPFSVSGHEPRTRITIYDVAGKLIHTLVDKEMEPGYYDIDWHPQELKAGIYFAKLSAGNYSLTKKLILLY